jgi:hypothetical protein
MRAPGLCLWLGLSLLAALAAKADAALPPAPFHLSASVSGAEVTVRAWYAEAEPPAGAERFDVYRAAFVGWDTAIFLAPDGSPAAGPVPQRLGISLAGFTPLETRSRWEGKVGSLLVALIVVRAGGSPLDRSQWAFQPARDTVTLRSVPPGGQGGGPGPAIPALLGLLALLASVLVALCPGAPRKLESGAGV